MAGACLGGLGARAQLGGRSPALRLAAAVCRAWKATQYNLRSLLRPGPLRSPAALGPRLDTRSLRLAALRKDGPHKLQRPAAQRPGERSACFTPPPLETQRPWGAQLPLRVDCSIQPAGPHLGRGLLLSLVNPTPQGATHEAYYRGFTHVYRLPAPVPGAGAGSPPRHAGPHGWDARRRPARL